VFHLFGAVSMQCRVGFGGLGRVQSVRGYYQGTSEWVSLFNYT
jgi:ABC-type methionine transport system permease subunit